MKLLCLGLALLVACSDEGGATDAGPDRGTDGGGDAADAGPRDADAAPDASPDASDPDASDPDASDPDAADAGVTCENTGFDDAFCVHPFTDPNTGNPLPEGLCAIDPADAGDG